MKVALVLPYNPLEEVGGLEIGTVIHAKTLIQQGHKAVIFTEGITGTINGVSVIGFADFSKLCLALLSQSEFDVFHWMEIFPGEKEVELQGMTSGLLKSVGKKTILMVATSGNMHNRGTGYLATPLLKSTMDAYVISNPAQLAEFAESTITDRIHIIGFGVDTSVFRPVNSQEQAALRRELELPLNKTLCLFVGRFVERKRPDFLLGAWEQLSSLHDQTTLVVVGSGMDQHDSIEGKVVQLAKSTPNAIFRGITKNPEKYYQACDLLLLPSDREGQPNVLMEMMSCGNPVIGSAIPGIVELLADEVNGLTFPVNNQTVFMSHIRRLVNDPNARKTLGREARSLIASTKDVQIVTRQYLKLYGET